MFSVTKQVRLSTVSRRVDTTVSSCCRFSVPFAVLVIAVVSLPVPLPAFGESGGEEYEMPLTLAAFLDQGLIQLDARSMNRWRDARTYLLERGENPTRVSLAFALILAKAGDYPDMCKTLGEVAEEGRGDVDAIRLTSWAKLSDRRIVEGLEDVCTLARRVSGGAATSEPTGERLLLTYVGQAVGFAAVIVDVTDVVPPSKRQRVEELVGKVDALLPASGRLIYENAKDGMESDVLDAIDDLLGKQKAAGDRQKQDKESERESLEERQRQMENAAGVRNAQAKQVQEEARQRLQSIRNQAAPLYQQAEVLLTELNQLQASQSFEKDEFAKKKYDPLISSAQGRLAGIRSQLAPLEMHYASIERTAIAQLHVLGVQINTLGRLHRADQSRLRKNAGKSEAGATPQVASEMRKRTRLATYLPLDFDEERSRLLGEIAAAPIGRVSLD
jgi:hypothetical protein